MLHRPYFARAGAAALCLSLAALLTGAFASCGSADVPNGPGATCATNADCESSLRCTDSVCTDPGGAGNIVEAQPVDVVRAGRIEDQRATAGGVGTKGGHGPSLGRRLP